VWRVLTVMRTSICGSTRVETRVSSPVVVKPAEHPPALKPSRILQGCPRVPTP
jgi:hypothetical protein